MLALIPTAGWPLPSWHILPFPRATLGAAKIDRLIRTMTTFMKIYPEAWNAALGVTLRGVTSPNPSNTSIAVAHQPQISDRVNVTINKIRLLSRPMRPDGDVLG